MNKKLYLSLAKNNIKKNKSSFYPFMLSAIAMIALFYMIFAIAVCAKESEGFYGDATIFVVLNLGVCICGIFAASVIFYTNGFLMKQRAKEMGLYSILGMEKRHIAKVIFWETAILGCLCIAAGLFFGIVFSKLMFLVLLKMMKLDAAIPFGIPVSVIVKTVLIFLLVFLAGILKNIVWVRFLKPMDLFKSSSQGEREPKAKWFSAVFGMICLGIGYTIAVTTENPLKALSLFFVAVLFVMAGTYLLFLSGSVALLKLLKRNKNYYYHKTHMISVSGMMYRMKRNAAGLANICILSTAVLVTISSTVSLYAGSRDLLNQAYPMDVNVSCYVDPQQTGENAFDPDKVKTAVLDHAAGNGLTVENEFINYGILLTVRQERANVFSEEREDINEAIVVSVISLEDYNRNLNEEDRISALSKGEAYAEDSERMLLDQEQISLCGMDYRIRRMPEEWMERKTMQIAYEKESSVIEQDFHMIHLAVATRQELMDLADHVNAKRNTSAGENLLQVKYRYLFDLNGEEEQILKFSSTLLDSLAQNVSMQAVTVGDIYTDKAFWESMYASVLFIGVFIGVIFLLAAVLIIYYKQISEGYEDRERFEILQKVGMSRKEVKKVITAQVLQVFFLPLALAAVHIAFAFSIIRRILSILGLVNVTLFIGCTVASILIFALAYGIVYYLTARTYYRIVYGS